MEHLSRRSALAADEWGAGRDVLRGTDGADRRRTRRLRLHLRQPARDAAAGPRRRAPHQRRAAERGLVRLQGQRGRAARGDRGRAPPRARARLRARGRDADPGRLRRHRARLPAGDGRRRRGDHPGARAGSATRRCCAPPTSCRSRCRSSRPASISTSPPSRRRSPPGPGWWWSTRRTTPPGGSIRAQTCRRSPTCSRRPRGGSARASGSSPTSPTGASASTATASPARRRSIPGR